MLWLLLHRPLSHPTGKSLGSLAFTPASGVTMVELTERKPLVRVYVIAANLEAGKIGGAGCAKQGVLHGNIREYRSTANQT
jgi:hypothetical protein